MSFLGVPSRVGWKSVALFTESALGLSHYGVEEERLTWTLAMPNTDLKHRNRHANFAHRWFSSCRQWGPHHSEFLDGVVLLLRILDHRHSTALGMSFA